MGDVRSGTASAGSSNKWAILLTVLIMTFMATLDSSIVNVALPVMQKALGAGLDQIQWISSVYLLTMCAFLLVFGRLGDLYGKVRYFEIGVVIFSIGSLMCGMSTSLPALVASRAVQGIGGASAMANNMGIITEAFPARERGRALALLEQSWWGKTRTNSRSCQGGCSLNWRASWRSA